MNDMLVMLVKVNPKVLTNAKTARGRIAVYTEGYIFLGFMFNTILVRPMLSEMFCE